MEPPQVLNVLIPVVATVATALGAFFISRRKNASTFVEDLVKEVEFYRGKNHSLEKEITLLRHENEGLKHDLETIKRFIRQ